MRPEQGYSQNFTPTDIFRDRTINKAVKEVNTHSDLFVESEIKRVGRKPVSIKFKIKERAKKKKFGKKEDELLKNEFIAKEVVDFIEILNSNYGIEASQARKLIKQYGIEKINGKIKIIEASDKYKTGQIKSLGGYLIKAIKDDYLPAKSSKDIVTLERLEKDKAAEIKKQIEQEKEAKEKSIKELYSKYVQHEIEKILSNLPKPKQTGIYNDFERELAASSNRVLFDRYKNQALASPIVKAIFHEFIFNNYSGLVQHIMDLDEFKKHQ